MGLQSAAENPAGAGRLGRETRRGVYLPAASWRRPPVACPRGPPAAKSRLVVLSTLSGTTKMAGLTCAAAAAAAVGRRRSGGHAAGEQVASVKSGRMAKMISEKQMRVKTRAGSRARVRELSHSEGDANSAPGRNAVAVESAELRCVFLVGDLRRDEISGRGYFFRKAFS